MIDRQKTRELATSQNVLDGIAQYKDLLDSYSNGKGELYSNMLYIYANAILSNESGISEDVLLCKAAFMAEFRIWGDENAVSAAYASVDGWALSDFKKSQTRFKESLSFFTALRAWWRFRGPFGLWKSGEVNSRKFSEYRQILSALGKGQWIQPDYELAKRMACD